MDPYAGKIVINGATSQYDRWLRALDPGFVRVDERSFSELLDFAIRFGSLINFYNLQDEIDGDWVEFFATDPVMLLASIGATAIAAIEARFSQLVRETREARLFDHKFQRLREVFGAILGLARQVDVWYRWLPRTPESATIRQLAQRVSAAIRGELGQQLRALQAADAGAGLPHALGRPIGLDYAGFSPIWGLGEHVQPDGAFYRGHGRSQRIDSALPRLGAIFDAFLYALAGFESFAKANLSASLASGNHKPHIALYIAFARLFQTAQDTLNTLSRRYVDFYYRDVLRERPRAAIPDSTYLTFTLAEGEDVLSATVPRGTLFTAGQDSDAREILYASDESLIVSGARLSKVRTLRVVRGPLIPGAGPSPVEASTRVVRELLASEILLEGAEEGASDETSVSAPPAWGTFGEREVGTSSVEVTAPATLGFAVASPYLWLTGGARTVSVGIHLSFASMERLRALLHELAAATGLTEARILRAVLKDALGLYVSTSTGWLPVETYDVCLPEPDEPDPMCPPLPGVEGVPLPRFCLRLWFPPSAPPFAPYAPEVEEGEGKVEPADPAPSLPTLKAYLRPQPVTLTDAVSVPPIALLGELEFEAIELRTWVDDLPSVELENTDGPIDPSAPFPMFGGQPVVGSYLQIRHAELFSKTISSLRVRLTWFNLPPEEDGFAGYYRDYTIGLDGRPQPDLFGNDTFLVDIGVQNPGTWSLWQPSSPVDGTSGPQSPLAGYFLFRTRREGSCVPPTERGPVCADTDFDELEVRPSTPPSFYDPAASAIRIGLSAPSYAFGSSLYPQNVLASVIKDLPNVGSCRESCLQRCRDKEGTPAYDECLQKCMYECMHVDPENIKYPNPPWLPQLTQVDVHYTAGCILRAGQGDAASGSLFHLLPFDGYNPIEAPPKKGGAPLFPRFPYEGNLYLGFSGLVLPQTLTLLFQLGGGDEQRDVPLPPVTWDYLAANRWTCLHPSQLLSDSTGGLQGSGVVKLGLPGFQSTTGSTILPPGYHWLRATVTEESDRFPGTSAIIPHAVLATWTRVDGSGGPPDEPLPPHTITGSVEELPDIGSIDQPMPSFAGVPAETPRTFEVRLGERLRHKDRAILCWDYARLVLERFPTIWKVQVLPARSPERGEVPGHVLVVIVPGSNTGESLDPTAPRATTDMLSRVQSYLESRVSPFIRLRVVNPIYVRIKVTAVIQFRDEESPGNSIAQLETELTRYLSPWFYDAARAARGGTYASEADISDFIQNQPYVMAVDTLGFSYDPPLDVIHSDWYFLTSAERHDLQAAGGITCSDEQRGY